jgi:hypothetical protein
MLEQDESDGFLIDLDLAIYVLRPAPSGAPARTGTPVFMASRVLAGQGEHSFVHDLESFFWVLFWICIHYNGPGKADKEKTAFSHWNSLTWDALAQSKDGLIQLRHFERSLTAHVTEYSKPLLPIALELRDALFPKGDPSGADEGLYEKVKKVLRSGIERLGKRPVG